MKIIIKYWFKTAAFLIKKKLSIIRVLMFFLVDTAVESLVFLLLSVNAYNHKTQIRNDLP